MKLVRKQSPLWQLNLWDAAKSTVVTAITAGLNVLVVSFAEGKLPTVQTLKFALYTGISAGIGYLVKNYLTNSSGELLKPEKRNLKP